MTGLRALIQGTIPVLIKGLRGRMRGARAFGVITIHLLLLGGLLGAVLALWVPNAGYTPPHEVGQGIFILLGVVLTVVTVFLAPALTSNAISSEHEAQTYEMLMLTPLPPAAIVLGKLGAALSYLLLIVLVSLPLGAITAIFGGVTPGDLVRLFVVLVTMALLSGSIGLFASAATRRTGCATVLAYMLVMAIWVGTIFVALLSTLFSRGDSDFPGLMLSMSPLFMLAILTPEPLGSDFPSWGITVGWSLVLTAWFGGAATALLPPTGRRRHWGRLLSVILGLSGVGAALGMFIMLLEALLQG